MDIWQPEIWGFITAEKVSSRDVKDHFHCRYYSLSREGMANTAPEEKLNNNTVVGERFCGLFSLHTSKHANYSHASTVIICSC